MLVNYITTSIFNNSTTVLYEAILLFVWCDKSKSIYIALIILPEKNIQSFGFVIRILQYKYNSNVNLYCASPHKKIT